MKTRIKIKQGYLSTGPELYVQKKKGIFWITICNTCDIKYAKALENLIKENNLV